MNLELLGLLDPVVQKENKVSRAPKVEEGIRAPQALLARKEKEERKDQRAAQVLMVDRATRVIR